MPESSSSSHSRASFGNGERLVAILALLVLAWLALLPLRPPEVVSADAPDTEFSAQRAMQHLKVIAAEPHPVGTPEHDGVRDYLVEQIEALGLEAQIQTATSVVGYRSTRVARVQNVLTRLAGSGGSDTLLIMAHYDSVPRSPGASDDGSGVVALLETLRALSAGDPLANDIIFLFTDGEEMGLLGARAFRREHPWADEVDLVFNFEARGGGGPSIMFETGLGTNGLIGRFAHLAPHPVASSYSYDVYRRLPNDTDFTIFKRGGKPGFNFAFIHDLPAYHTPLDTLDRIDPRSVQHHGSYALSLLRGFGNTALQIEPEEEVKVYFNLPFLGLVIYSSHLVLPLTILAVLLTIAVLVIGFRRRRLRLGPLLLGLLLFPVTLAVVGAGITFLHQGIFALLVRKSGVLPDPAVYRWGLTLCGLGLAFGMAAVFGRKPGTPHLAAGALLGWLGLASFTTLDLQSSSYLLVWPLLCGLFALLLFIRVPPGDSPPRGASLLLLALAIPALWLWVPMFSLIGAAFAGGSATMLAVLASLLASTLHPQVALLTGVSRRFLLPVAFCVVGLGVMLVQALGAGFDAQHSQTNTLFYALDAEEGTSLWGSHDRKADRWTAQYLGESPQRRPLFGSFFRKDFQVLAAEAPVFSVPQLEVSDLSQSAMEDSAVEGDSPEGLVGETSATESSLEEADLVANTKAEEGPHRIHLRLRPTGPTVRVDVKLTSASRITKLEIDGHSVDLGTVRRPEDAPPGFWSGSFYGQQDAVFELDVELEEKASLEFESVTIGSGLPEVPGASYEPRPKDLQPHSYRFTDSTLARQVHTF